MNRIYRTWYSMYNLCSLALSFCEDNPSIIIYISFDI